MRTRRAAGTWKPAREEPEARARARLATRIDLPTFGSPPTKRIPEEGSRLGSIRAGVGVGLCSSNWTRDNTPEGDEFFFKVDVTAKPPESHPEGSVRRLSMPCVKPPDVERSVRVCSLCAGRLW